MDGSTARHLLPQEVGSFGLADDGRLVVALASGIFMFSPREGTLDLLVEPEPGHTAKHPGDRLNDGKVGPDGAFWVGSMHKNSPTASLFRITAEGRAERKVCDLNTSNGLAFSGDRQFMYHSDSRVGWIDRYRFEASTGNISSRERIAQLNEGEGRPDGGATDVEGCYWSAGVTAGCLNRFSPDGKLLARIDLPVRRPTMICFGGADMRTLFVTSIRRPEDAGDLCGNVLMVDVDVPGVPVNLFRTIAKGEGADGLVR